MSGTESGIVAAEELRAFVERYETIEARKKDETEDQKNLIQELVGRGYEAKIFRKIIALRKRTPDDIAEEESILELYKTALGMV